MSGPTEHIAEALAGYARLGFSDVIADVNPDSQVDFDRFAAAVNLFRSAG